MRWWWVLALAVAMAAATPDTDIGGVPIASGDADGSCGTGEADASGGGGGCGCGAVKREEGAMYSESASSTTASLDEEGEEGQEEASASTTSQGCVEGCEDTETAAMVALKGGKFLLGSDDGFFPEDREGPTWKVQVSPFRIGKYEVSNRRFKAFVKATGYVTEAERFGNSFAVEQFVSPEESAKINSAVAAAPWWIPVNGASWLHPEGIDSNLSASSRIGVNRWNHPAVHVSYNDAEAFCKWSVKGGRLPTEAEWEYAASGGKQRKKFPWGNTQNPKGKHRMNTWQSTIQERFLKDRNVFLHSYLPTQDGHTFYSAKNSAEDGWELTCPVNAYAPNAYGLYNTVGNVWEWTSDWRVDDPSIDRTSFGAVDPKGPPNGTNKVKKGGSFMCHQFTCYRFRISARMFITPDSSASNVGFRCAADADPSE